MHFKQAFGTFTKGLEKAVNAASSVAQVVAEEGSGLVAGSSRLLREYRVDAPVATCGPLDIWAIYSGTCKKQGAVQRDVAIWILDKRKLQESGKQAPKTRAFDVLFEQQKKGAQNLTRLKHPGVVKVIEPLDDTANQMVLVTEPIFGSLRNVLTHFSSVPGATAEAREAKFSSLDIKQGLVLVADTLTFLHAEAGISHCGLSPHVVMVTGDGAWKLAGFAHALPAAAAATAQPFSYSDPFPPLWDELTKPLLPYVAPELVAGFGSGCSIGPAADVFSLAATVYELLSGGAPLLPVRNALHEYKAAVAALQGGSGGSTDGVAAMPPAIQGVLRSMLAPSAASRPAVGALTSCGYFQDDIMLRALRFLDTILQRDYAQKVAFIKDLAQFWTQIDDDRVLALRVLPPLIQELRTSEPLQPTLLPLVLAMLERVAPAHFMSTLLPALLPVIENAQGELLGTLLGGSALLARLMTQEAVGRLLIPLYSRALDADALPHVQDTCLRTLQTTLPTLDYALLKTQIMPRTYTMCMRTTAASVRANALVLMTQAVARLDKDEAAAMIDTAAQVVSVDRSAATVAHVARLADALSQQHGTDVTAQRLLPLLCPLLAAPSLGVRDVQALHATIQGMLDRVCARALGEQAMGTTTGASGRLAPQGPTPGSPAASKVAWDTPLDPPTHRQRPHGQPPAVSGSGAATTTPAPAASSWLSPAPPGGAPAPLASAPLAANSSGAGWMSGFSGPSAGSSHGPANGGQAAAQAQADLFGGLALHDPGPAGLGPAATASHGGRPAGNIGYTPPQAPLFGLPSADASPGLGSLFPTGGSSGLHGPQGSGGNAGLGGLGSSATPLGLLGVPSRPIGGSGGGGGPGLGLGSTGMGHSARPGTHPTSSLSPTSSDPFSTLSVMALSAPKAQASAPTVSAVPSFSSPANTRLQPRISALPPPPRASTAIGAPQAQQQVPSGASEVDLLW